jgi:hypothetical protein
VAGKSLRISELAPRNTRAFHSANRLRQKPDFTNTFSLITLSSPLGKNISVSFFRKS